MLSVILGSVMLAASLSMAILVVRWLQRFCDPPPPEHCFPPWMMADDVHDKIDNCEICGAPPVVTVMRCDAETKTFHAVVLCDDCYHDDLEMIAHKPVGW